MTAESPLMPSITLHPLTNSDGSALYASPNNTLSILSSVSYPLEIPQRSSELPSTTLIDVNLRPHNAVAGVKERHIESIVKRVLESVVMGEETPRCMLQVGLQLVHVTEYEGLPGGVKGGGQGESYMEVLCAALNAAIAGCLDGGVKMRRVMACVLIGENWDGTTKAWPSLREGESRTWKSLHVVGIDSTGNVLVMESEGRFQIGVVAEAQRLATNVVLGHSLSIEDRDNVVMSDDSKESNLMALLRTSVQHKIGVQTKRNTS